MNTTERKSIARSYLGKTVNITVDRPLGSRHPKHKNIVYPVNYGYINGTVSGDGEEIDVYILGLKYPVREYTAEIIGVVHREDDNEDKLIAAPRGTVFFQHEIAKAVKFQEQYFKTKIEALYEKSCGTVLYTVIGGVTHYLLIKASEEGYCGFPKGHMEEDETEEETALRETWEETSVRAIIKAGFRREDVYPLRYGKTKQVIYFLASFSGQKPHHNKGFEHNIYMLLPYEEALRELSHENTRAMLTEANEYINTNIIKK